jgi:hypothetical protein
MSLLAKARGDIVTTHFVVVVLPKGFPMEQNECGIFCLVLG